MSNIWKEIKKPFFILAPMEDVTDVVFRQVIKKAGKPDIFFTEFTNSESFVREGYDSVRSRLVFKAEEKPIIAHIWGDNPEYFKEMSFALKDLGFDGIDINMGCPAANVVRHHRGSGLILKPDFASEIIEATKAGGLPVSVKTRLGYYKVEEYKEWISHLLKHNISNLSIHLRSKKEMSDVAAHYEIIPEIIKLRDKIAPGTLITINGDIKDYQMGLQLVEKYNVDGIMIGRGVFKNPFAFNKQDSSVNVKKVIDLFKYHLDLFDQYQTQLNRSYKPLRRFFKIYIQGFPQANKLRNALMETENTDEVRILLDKFLEDY